MADQTQHIQKVRDEIAEHFGEQAAMYFDVHLKPAMQNFGWFEFSGDNCEDCPGWDGLSCRCNCGNRRVSWDWFYGALIAEAY